MASRRLSSGLNPWRASPTPSAFGLDCQEVIRAPLVASGARRRAGDARSAPHGRREGDRPRRMATFNAAFAWPSGGDQQRPPRRAETYQIGGSRQPAQACAGDSTSRSIDFDSTPSIVVSRLHRAPRKRLEADLCVFQRVGLLRVLLRLDHEPALVADLGAEPRHRLEVDHAVARNREDAEQHRVEERGRLADRSSLAHSRGCPSCAHG